MIQIIIWKNIRLQCTIIYIKWLSPSKKEGLYMEKEKRLEAFEKMLEAIEREYETTVERMEKLNPRKELMI